MLNQELQRESQQVETTKVKPKPVFVIATQRSGTNLFRSLLVSTGYFTDFKEVFHSNTNSEINFFNFRRKLYAKNLELSLPSNDNLKKIFNQYLKHLKSKANTPYFFVDIKYNSFGHLAPYWQGQLEIPRLLNLIKSHKFPIIHIVRDNVLETECSLRLAQKNLNHTLRSNEKLKFSSVHLDKETIKDILDRRLQEIELFKSWLDDYKPVIEIEYSNIIEDNSLSQSAKDRLSKLLDLNITQTTKTPYKKMASSLKNTIENYEEIHGVLKDNYSDLLK